MTEIDTKVKEAYRQALADSVHFSVKTTNSNIDRAGVRLNVDQLLDLPYVSARTLLADDIYIPVDYQANAGKTATLFKTIKAAALNEPPEEADEQTLAELGFVTSLLPDLKKQALVAGDKHIDVRMRQLLIPKADAYISLSPLTAAGLCHVVNTEVDAVKQQVESLGKDAQLNKLKTALMGIGGSNAQNVGSLVRAMQRPVLVSAPQSEKSRQHALSVFYKGFRYSLHTSYFTLSLYKSLLDVNLWITKQEVTAGKFAGGMKAPKTNLKARSEESIHLLQVINYVLQQGAERFELLKLHQEAIPTIEAVPRSTFWSHPRVNPVVKGLIDVSLQSTDDWKRAFAEDLAKQLINYKHWPEKDKSQGKVKMLSLDLDEEGKSALPSLIMRLLP